ncbi:MAG TPA: VOC family protein [Acidobacteriota bacterium]|nr:VOC family protein [Acidobacteriota bacterium]
MANEVKTGSIGWIDLTVPDAEKIRDFYEKVAGWRHEGVDMGGYQDFSMIPGQGESAVAGICHARGTNADLPASWLIYIVVDDLDASMATCREGGGEVISGPHSMGAQRYCVIRDPAGAVAALYQQA